MPRHTLDRYEPTYAAAEIVRDRLLVNLDSLFTPGEVLWTPNNLQRVHARFAAEDDQTHRTFWEKLSDEFAGSSRSERQLFAELYYLHVLGPSNITGATKRSDLARLLDGVDGVDVPTDLDAGLDHGVASAGMAFTTGKFWQLVGLLDFFERWIPLNAETRESTLADPWAFRTFVVDTTVRGDAQRNLLLHLVHPDIFEDIASKYSKNAIAKHWGRADDPNVDRALAAIREDLGNEYGPSGFYGASLRPLWEGKDLSGAERIKLDWAALGMESEAAESLLAALMAGIQAADSANAEGWELGLTGGRIRLNCGQNACFTIEANNVQLTYSPQILDAEARAALEQYDTGAFNRPDGVHSAHIPRDVAAQTIELVWPAYLDACARSASSVQRTGYYKSHDPELIEYIAARVGETLPQPGYLDEGTTSADTGVAFDRGAWLVRPGRRDDDQLDAWLADDYCAIGWDEVGFVTPGTSRSEIRKRVRATYPEDSENKVGVGTGNIDRFVNQIDEGDVVVAPRDQDIHVGIVKSEARWEEGKYATRRSVEWATKGNPIQREDLSRRAYSKLKTLLTVTDITEVGAEFADRAGLSDEALPIATAEITLDEVTKEMAERLLLPKEWLDDLIDMLAEKRQLIFFGPPGTGKTYIAQELAEHLTGGDRMTLVQFHPSYTYEDFVEGFRPVVQEDGTLRFELVPGPLREIADAARSNPTDPYVLVIDEINRANLPKVFGELYFLLEYREQAVTLQYGSGDTFTLPENLFVIGTMNTADRSIALIDSAMRRRFYFIGFLPTQPPIDGLLARWLDHNGIESDAHRLLEELNARIDDPDYSIGPSYLMGESGSDAFLERVWAHSILPLLDEHFIGTTRDVRAEFSLSALRASITPTEAAVLDQIDPPEEPA